MKTDREKQLRFPDGYGTIFSFQARNGPQALILKKSDRRICIMFIVLGGGLLIIIIAVVISVVSSVVSAVAADVDDAED
jgi:hypothetical protein